MIANKLIDPIEITKQDWDKNTVPVLTVFSWTFNHKDFIRESIESILMQKTTFPVEIIIHDDASSDGTKEIILEYQNRFPKLFNNILQEENQWSQGKCVTKPLFENPKGKYIALTHGDDYWTDPYKLQKQVDFLEENLEFVGCFHKVKILDENKTLKEDNITKVPQDYQTVEDMISKGNYIHTPSFIFRNIVLEIPDEFFNSPLGDYFLYIILGLSGNYGYVKDSMAVYRNYGGVWSSSSIRKKYLANIKTFLLIEKYLSRKNKKLAKLIKDRIFLKNDITLEEIKELYNINPLILELYIKEVIGNNYSIKDLIETKTLFTESFKRIIKKI